MDHHTPIQIFGEVLFDNFQDGSRVLGGAPFNVAWHLQAFGLAPNFISRIGNDLPGQEISNLMASWGMLQSGLQTDNAHATGSVQVQLINGEPHYEIVTNSAYDFIDAEALNPLATEGILYHGTLALRNSSSLAALNTLKSRHHGPIFIDVNLRSPWWDTNQLIPLLADATWVKLNVAELYALGFQDPNLETAMQAFHSQFGLQLLILTQGEKGAVVCDAQQGFHSLPPTANNTMVDTVGAGDAYAAVTVLGLSQQWPLSTTLTRAQAFASAIVGQHGATVPHQEFYQAFLESWA
ncbi:MAG: PfkB family carbohydrate kinase [Methylococcaceae bacterium]